MAGEALKLSVATNLERSNFKPAMLLYNGWSKEPSGTFRMVGLRRKRRGCVVCDQDYMGDEKITTKRLKDSTIDYQTFCGVPEDTKILTPDQRVNAAEFEALMTSAVEDGTPPPVVVDTREEHEVEMGARITGSINIPFSRILREQSKDDDGTGEHSIWADILKQPKDVYFVCQRGNDSQIAAKRLMNATEGHNTQKGQNWIGDVEGGFEALERRMIPKE